MKRKLLFNAPVLAFLSCCALSATAAQRGWDCVGSGTVDGSPTTWTLNLQAVTDFFGTTYWSISGNAVSNDIIFGRMTRTVSGTARRSLSSGEITLDWDEFAPMYIDHLYNLHASFLPGNQGDGTQQLEDTSTSPVRIKQGHVIIISWSCVPPLL